METITRGWLMSNGPLKRYGKPLFFSKHSLKPAFTFILLFFSTNFTIIFILSYFRMLKKLKEKVQNYTQKRAVGQSHIQNSPYRFSLLYRYPFSFSHSRMYIFSWNGKIKKNSNTSTTEIFSNSIYHSWQKWSGSHLWESIFCMPAEKKKKKKNFTNVGRYMYYYSYIVRNNGGNVFHMVLTQTKTWTTNLGW